MYRNFYFISVKSHDYNTAAIKAPKDIETILENRGYKKLEFMFPRRFKNERFSIWIGRLASILNWLKAFCEIKKDALVLIQYPYGCKRMALKALPIFQKYKNIKFILLLHDIDSLRGYNKESSNSSEKILKMADSLICHNDKMKNYLLSQDIPNDKLYTLGIFDYLCEHNPPQHAYNNTIVIAGNLSSRKSPYIDLYLKMGKNYPVNLFGPNYVEGEHYINANYCGSFGPEEIPMKINGNWGLVWDGDSLDSCTGETGNYLRFNNPHKLSLYIAAGIPVIIWKEAAMAKYVEDKEIGITVASLKEIEQKILAVSKDEYNKMIKNVEIEAEKLRNGMYFQKVITSIEDKYQNDI